MPVANKINPNLATIRCPSCTQPCEYDRRDYLNIHCPECGNMFRPPPVKRKGGNRRGKRKHGPYKVPTKQY